MDAKIRKADVARLIAASFPSYSGRTFRASECDKVCFSNLNWCEGSRSQYVILDLATGRRADMRQLSRNAPWNQPMECATVPLPAGVVVVEHAIFSGKDCGLRFYFNPADKLALTRSVPALQAPEARS